MKDEMNSRSLVEALAKAEQLCIDQKSQICQLKTKIKKMEGLREIILICASCKRIKKEDDSWEQMEAYISKHFPVDFSHSICKSCAKKLYPQLFKKK